MKKAVICLIMTGTLLMMSEKVEAMDISTDGNRFVENVYQNMAEQTYFDSLPLIRQVDGEIRIKLEDGSYVPLSYFDNNIEYFDYTVTNVEKCGEINCYDGKIDITDNNSTGIFFSDDFTVQKLTYGDKVRAYFKKDDFEGLLYVEKR